MATHMQAENEVLDGGLAAIASGDFASRSCATQLFGLWAIRAEHFRAMWGEAHRYMQAHGAPPQPKAQDGIGRRPGAPPVTKVGNVAIMGVHGPLSKNSHSFMEMFGGTATAETRNMLRQLAQDDDIEAILMHVDSPGGSVAGTGDLADDVAAVSQVKPVFAYAEDLMASAAYWVGSQATAVFASPHAEIGSIGTFAHVWDDSKMYEDRGVRSIIVKAGEHKGDFAQGVPVTDEMLADLQRNVNEMNAQFVEGVARGRDMDLKQAYKLADGRIHTAKDAKKLGLIDKVATLDGAVHEISKMVGAKVDRKQASNGARLFEALCTPLPDPPQQVLVPSADASKIIVSADGNTTLRAATPASGAVTARTNTEPGLQGHKDSKESGQEGTGMSQVEAAKVLAESGIETVADDTTQDPAPVETKGKDDGSPKESTIPLSEVEKMLAKRDEDIQALQKRLDAREQLEQTSAQSALAEHRNKIAAKHGVKAESLEVFETKEALDTYDTSMEDMRATVIRGLSPTLGGELSSDKGRKLRIEALTRQAANAPTASAKAKLEAEIARLEEDS